MNSPLNPDLQFRLATPTDLPIIVGLLVDDVLGEHREAALADVGKIDPAYQIAFDEIAADPSNELIVGVLNGKTVAVLQLTYIPNLTLRGQKRVLIEGVRVSSHCRGQKIGHRLFEFALTRARERGCRLAQLTTNKARPDAARFYAAFGFEETHVGFKLHLS